MELGVRVAYPGSGGYDWYEALKPYPAVEVAFRDPEAFPGLSLDKILSPWRYGGIRTTALSIHMPHVNPTNLSLFWGCLRHTMQLAKELRVHHLVIHPQNGRLEVLQPYIESYTDALVHPDYLCWETFLSKRRFVNTIESIAEAGLYACYDTSHMRKDSEGVLNDLFKYKDTIKVVHLSNFDEYGQHLPLRQGVLDMRTILVYLDEHFDGPVILEYLPQYHHLYLDDIRWAWEKVLK